MGMAKYSCGALANTQKQHFLFSCWSRRPISCTTLCGLMLFALGLISLFTGHVASNLELYSHSFGRGAWFYKQDGGTPIDIWKSRYSTSYYGCSERGPRFASAVSVRSSNGYLLIATSGGLNQQRTGVLQLTKFDYRLANDLDEELQKLRCRVNYHALRFTKPIRNFGQKLVVRMRKMARRFIAVHLRFEPDMLAFSGCYYGGGDKERYELGEIRKRWATLPELSPDEERTRGRCPLTPHEVGLMLRALGFKNDTYLYVASGEVYGGEKTLQPLKELFPNFYTKEIVAGDELKPFLPYSSRLAAIDYIVCDESDVFVTNNNGNMAKILAGSRRYMGHKRTIRPNAKRLSALFMARNKMDWDTFSRKVKSCQSGFMGEPEEMRPGRGEFHEFPSSCICKTPFNHSNFIDKYNNHTSGGNPTLPDSRYRYIHNSSDLDEKSLQKLY
ncbi:O-fucosyltransferase 29-like isoform X3 [Lycium barbarum]|uniref:O-fucosyltransferase 29-like isoform X3 n=1 Tax=Lycium barbarum TaxID=112863 RepID=UPI00293E426B|nr:O-fucosyltransferase 29-like isoform X3 [Lycium barbarum]